MCVSGSELSPRYSIILPVCHGGHFLRQALGSLVQVKPPTGGFEVLVIGQPGSLAMLPKMTPNAPEIRIVASAGIRSVLLNIGCARARGTVWVFADDDCVFPADWLLKIEQSLANHPEASVLGGMDVLVHGTGVFDIALDEVLNSFIGTAGVRRESRIRAGRYYPKLWNMTVVAEAARKAAVDGVQEGGIFDTTLTVHEDVDLIRRISAQGGKVVYVSDIRVLHYRDTDFSSFFQRNMKMAKTCRRLGVHRFAHLLSVAGLIGIPAIGLASLFSETMKGIALLTAGTYAAAIILTGIKGVAKRRQILLMGWIPLLVISLHTARAVGYLFPTFVLEDSQP